MNIPFLIYIEKFLVEKKHKQRNKEFPELCMLSLVKDTYMIQSYHVNLRARSKMPVFGLTGRAPGWPGALKTTRRNLATGPKSYS